MQRKAEFYEQFKGKRQGHLLIIDYSQTKKRVGKMWECRCDCGRTVLLPTSKIASGHAEMCPECSLKGNRERSAKQLTKHGEGKTRLHSIWMAMISRCKFKGDTNYRYYGLKGITVCQEWESDFVRFKEWAESNGYRNNLTIDRIDSEKGYYPENCRWVPMTVQNINKAGTRLITVNGITMCLTHWARAIGISHSALCKAKNTEGYIKNHFPTSFYGYTEIIKGEPVFIWTGQGA